MPMNLDAYLGVHADALKLRSQRTEVLARNLANADTPGYHARDIDFQFELQNAAGSEPRILEAGGLVTKNDGNNVSLDRESRLLAENALRFQMASNLLRSQIRAVELIGSAVMCVLTAPGSIEVAWMPNLASS